MSFPCVPRYTASGDEMDDDDGDGYCDRAGRDSRRTKVLLESASA